MKLFTLATILLLFTVACLAKSFDFAACTADHKQVLLTLDLLETASDSVKVDIAKVFKNVASQLTVIELASPAGFEAFVHYLSQEDKEAINDFEGPPSVTGSCK